MAVVINELEVAPAPAAKPESASQPAARQGPATISPDTAREMEKMFQRKQDRIHRLTAY